MPFNHLHFESLLPGITLAADRASGCHSSANLERGPDETVLLFHLDQDQTRERLKLSGKKCCDHLYFYKSPKQTLLIFVELKSTEIGQAMEQIASAHDAICNNSRYVESMRLAKSRLPIICAVVVSATAPKNDKKEMQLRMKDRGIFLAFGTSRGRHCPIKETLSNFFR